MRVIPMRTIPVSILKREIKKSFIDVYFTFWKIQLKASWHDGADKAGQDRTGQAGRQACMQAGKSPFSFIPNWYYKSIA